ncbi:MAG: hypothetical protein HY812_10010 [Planctomycetes bacterium]|nr:hypothetical protein [Planctomycetota bacterium]
MKNRTNGAAEGARSDALRWEAGIPLVTNPFLWVDMGKALGIAYVFFSCLMLWILREEPWEEIWPAWRVVTFCVLGVLGLLLFVCLAVYRNRFAARFLLDAQGVRYESGRLAKAAAGIAVAAGALCRSAALAGSGLLAASQSSLFLRWQEVRKVSAFPRFKVITLSNSWRPVLRLYCPDGATYERALAIAGASIRRAGAGSGPRPPSCP